MKAPLFVRPVTDDERKLLQAGLRSSDAFVMRRCQIILASARRERARAIAQQLSCDDQTARNAIKQFNATGLDALQAGSSRETIPIQGQTAMVLIVEIAPDLDWTFLCIT